MKKNNKNWNGYDMEELRIRQATTSLRIEIEKERLKCSASNMMSRFNGVNDIDTTITTANDMMYTLEYGIKSYKLIKKIINLYQNLKK